MKFKGDYVVVRTPKTTNGILPLIKNGQQQYKETSLPISAVKHLQRMNKKLPTHLKMTWEVVHAYKPQPIQQEPKQEPTVRNEQRRGKGLGQSEMKLPTDYDLEAAFGKGI